MWFIVAGIVVVLLLTLLGIAAAKPSTFRVQRSSNINAEPEKIFSLKISRGEYVANHH